MKVTFEKGYLRLQSTGSAEDENVIREIFDADPRAKGVFGPIVVSGGGGARPSFIEMPLLVPIKK